ncbi:MAG: hypothetical protein AAF586_05485 [Planctomycetota bacterium]
MVRLTSLLTCLVASAPALGELVVPARASESRIALWIVIVVSLFLVALVGFGVMLSSRRTHQD